ncbi:MAG: hypothetical protein AABZ06_03155 [Bdellovibrionota bacterium]
MKGGAVTTDRIFAIFGADYRYNEFVVSPGIELAERDWRTNSGDVTYRDLLPNVWFKLPAFGHENLQGKSSDAFRVGYISTWHRAFGPLELRDPQDEDGRLEHRLDLAYEFNFSMNASLALMATGDLDKFLTDKSWDGGSGMLRVRF